MDLGLGFTGADDLLKGIFFQEVSYEALKKKSS